MNWSRVITVSCAALLCFARVSTAAIQSISLDAVAAGSSAYYEYNSDAFGSVERVEIDGRNRFHSPIINPTIKFGGATFDMFPNNAAMKFGAVTYDDAGLVNGSGTVSLTGITLGLITNPAASNYFNFARYGSNAETQTLGALTGTATFNQGTLASLDLSVPVNITVPFSVHTFQFSGLFTTNGFNFNFDAAAPTPASLTTFTGPTVAAVDWQGQISAVAVPEPGTWALLFSAAGGLIWWGRLRNGA